MKLLNTLFLTLLTSSFADTVEVQVSQDTWAGMSEETQVLQNVAPNELRISTPNPAGAFQYNRRAVFGFDLSSIDLKEVKSVTFSAKTSQGIDGLFNNGAILRAYLISNQINDKFDQSTATGKKLVEAGFYKIGMVPDDLVTGISIGEYTTSGEASGQMVRFTFGADALANLKEDTNQFATILIEKRSLRNIGHDPVDKKNIGMAFESLETPGGTPATLAFEVTPKEAPSCIINLGGISLGIETNDTDH